MVICTQKVYSQYHMLFLLHIWLAKATVIFGNFFFGICIFYVIYLLNNMKVILGTHARCILFVWVHRICFFTNDNNGATILCFKSVVIVTFVTLEGDGLLILTPLKNEILRPRDCPWQK